MYRFVSNRSYQAHLVVVVVLVDVEEALEGVLDEADLEQEVEEEEHLEEEAVDEAVCAYFFFLVLLMADISLVIPNFR